MSTITTAEAVRLTDDDRELFDSLVFYATHEVTGRVVGDAFGLDDAPLMLAEAAALLTGARLAGAFAAGELPRELWAEVQPIAEQIAREYADERKAAIWQREKWRAGDAGWGHEHLTDGENEQDYADQIDRAERLERSARDLLEQIGLEVK